MLKSFLLTCLLTLSTVAHAEPEANVVFTLLDEQENPVPKAWIEFPDESMKHAVNEATGSTSVDMLYLPDGKEIFFVKDMMLDFETGAPGYKTQKRSYRISKKKDTLTVTLLKTNEAVVEKERFDVFFEELWVNWTKPTSEWWANRIAQTFQARVLHSDALIGTDAFLRLLAERSTSEFNEQIRIDSVTVHPKYGDQDGILERQVDHKWANAFVTLTPGEGPPQRAHIFVLATRYANHWALQQFQMRLLPQE